MLNKISPVINRENPPTYRTNHHFLPCNNCGSQVRRIGAGKVPGGASLVCECGRFIKWISKVELTKFQNQGGQG